VEDFLSSQRQAVEAERQQLMEKAPAHLTGIDEQDLHKEQMVFLDGRSHELVLVSQGLLRATNRGQQPE